MPKYVANFEGFVIIEAENITEADLMATYKTLSDCELDIYDINEYYGDADVV